MPKKRGIRFASLGSRLTGFSTPIFGVSWDPPEAEVEAARRVLTYLEDRRVLYVPSEVEIPRHCVESVLKIRVFLTSELGRGATGQEVESSLRAMRAACRKFLGAVGDPHSVPGWDGSTYRPGHSAQWDFDSALGQLRGVFGIHVAKLAAAFGLDVEEGLAAILPGEDEEDERH